VSRRRLGLAARDHHKVGELLSISNLNADDMLHLIHRVRTHRQYNVNALCFKKVIEQTRGLDFSADLLKEALERAVCRRA
jgi:UDP:flavonoid glycosyltransferase YjiC (YdhE family)